MICMSCAADIKASYVHAISTNCCPGCGNSIMNDAAKELLTEIKDALKQMDGNPEGLAGWLLSNYEMRKIGTAEPVPFYGKPVPKFNNYEPSNQHQNFNQISPFMQRAEVDQNLLNGNKYKQLVSEIYNKDDIVDIAQNEVEMDDDQFNKLEAAKAKAIGRRTGNSLVTNDPPIEQHELPMLAQMIDQLGAGESVLDTDPRLRNQRMQRLEAQERIASGIKAHKKGGFHRVDE